MAVWLNSCVTISVGAGLLPLTKYIPMTADVYVLIAALRVFRRRKRFIRRKLRTVEVARWNTTVGFLAIFKQQKHQDGSLEYRDEIFDENNVWSKPAIKLLEINTAANYMFFPFTYLSMKFLYSNL